MNGPGLAVAASPVAGEAGQNMRCGPLACPLAPTVEMLLQMGELSLKGRPHTFENASFGMEFGKPR